MFIVSIRYKKPLSEVDRYIKDHVLYLEKFYKQGCFILSGRKEPRTGGVIMAKADNRKSLELILKQDPFSIADVADYEITEFIPTMASDNITTLKMLIA